jgi:peptide deformylase
MALREILTYPHPILRQQAAPVTDFDAALEELLADMAETMYAAPGIGLAANQIGIPLQIVVIDIAPKGADKELLEFLNPQLAPIGEETDIDEEGCLSVVDYTANVKRFRHLQVTAQDRHGKSMEFEAVDLLARVLQHEVDHLRGRLFIDHLSALKRSLYKKKRKKQLQQDEQAA